MHSNHVLLVQQPHPPGAATASSWCSDRGNRALPFGLSEPGLLSTGCQPFADSRCPLLSAHASAGSCARSEMHTCANMQARASRRTLTCLHAHQFTQTRHHTHTHTRERGRAHTLACTRKYAHKLVRVLHMFLLSAGAASCPGCHRSTCCRGSGRRGGGQGAQRGD